MTVKELIEHLQQLDPDLRVFTYGSMGGFDDVEGEFRQEAVALDYHKEWYYGKHEAIDDIKGKDKSKYTIVKGIIL